MELVTGFKGEPHISAENWADLNRGIVGEGSYVLPGGEKFRAELVTNNLLKIYDGCGIMQGRQIVIPAGQSDEITIDNGTQGEKRIDLVGVRYTKDDSSKIESTAPFYLKGTPAESDPVAPAYTEGDIRAGDLTADWPLYELELDGLNVVSVTPLFETLLTGADVKAELEALNDNNFLINEPVPENTVNPSTTTQLLSKTFTLDRPRMAIIGAQVTYSNVTYDDGQRQCRITVNGDTVVWQTHNIKDINIYVRGVHIAMLQEGDNTVGLGAYFSSTTGNGVKASGRLSVTLL